MIYKIAFRIYMYIRIYKNPLCLNALAFTFKLGAENPRAPAKWMWAWPHRHE